MNKEQAKKRLLKFMGNSCLTFSVKQNPNDKWVAQCNEIDSIITCGEGYDMATMESLMQDAILTAAGIPKEFSDGMLKRELGDSPVVPVHTEIDSNSYTRLFQSIYRINDLYAGMGQVSAN